MRIGRYFTEISTQICLLNELELGEYPTVYAKDERWTARFLFLCDSYTKEERLKKAMFLAEEQKKLVANVHLYRENH